MEWLFSSDTKLITLYQINWPAPLVAIYNTFSYFGISTTLRRSYAPNRSVAPE